MIVGLKGVVQKLEPMYVEMNVNGVIYGVQMSLNAVSALRQKIDSAQDKQARIICLQIIREDAHLLFGFCEEVEKSTFERLIKISGVGPKVAMAILSTYTPESFARIVFDKDIDALKRVPGIGAKVAGKILVDIAGFFAQLIPDQTALMSNYSGLKHEASLALSSLGFKGGEIQKVLRDIEGADVSEIVREALKKLA